jgi:hypothetical protein
MKFAAGCVGKIAVATWFTLAVSSAFSASEITDVTPVTVRGTEIREFDWAKLHAQARIVYISSGPKMLSGRLIDNDLQSVFRFSESDAAPIAIVELASGVNLHRVSAVFKAEDAKVDVFLLNKMPKDPADLRFSTPDASVTTLPDERGTMTVNFAVSSARYVALRWKRNRRDEPFSVAEISAFSNDPTTLVSGEDAALAVNAKTFAIAAPPTVGVLSP